MFKKLFFALIALLSASTVNAAQLTATLQSGETVTPFYGDSAFIKAYQAAVDGDVITLSPGVFKITNIKKSISLIGYGAFGSDESKITQLYDGQYALGIIADNVKIQGIKIPCIFIYATENLSVRRSNIQKIYDFANSNNNRTYHNNTTFTDCLIDYHYGMSKSKNAVLRNCCINQFCNCNEASNLALIENCNLPSFAYYDSSGMSIAHRQPYAIYRNCFIGLYANCGNDSSPQLSFNTPTELHNVCFYRNYYYGQSSSYNKAWTLNYGSCKTSGVVMPSTAIKYSVTFYKNSYLYDSFSPYVYNS